MTEGSEIAWTALEPGTVVVSSDGEEIGRVKDVIADEQKDIFSGVTFGGLLDSDRIAPADLIASITETGVRLTIPSSEVETLDRFEP